MNTLDAARYLMRAYPGGADSLAPRLDKSSTTLRHEVAAHGAYKLGLLDAEEITQMALEQHVPNAMAILHAMATNCGAMVIALPSGHTAVADATYQDLAAAAKSFADFVAVSAQAPADGRVTGNELRDVDRELGALIACAHRVRGGLAAMHAAQQQEGAAAPAFA
jgi:hypothetical protein